MDTTPNRSLRALVLDHDAAALHEVRRSLEDRRVSVLYAADGWSGLELLLCELLDLDVLVTEVNLPGRDARSLAHLIRRAGGERDLAIVVLANEPTEVMRAELVALGIDAVVDRSKGPAAVAEAVMKVVSERNDGSGRAITASRRPARRSASSARRGAARSTRGSRSRPPCAAL